ncbi:hypothetical protein IAE39_003792 [Pseudomonas sp. S37]|uniref:dermonecrotic toxin domain-containing protein n=1 Tax=Pseudomonas sp. S37 TaxID=2767449 RepID=UPI0019130E69|nr:DUF6543 domain-containing protein [Pseudomonas sp. S37]MBK4995618.1 hypothetical protein [Pseudomonas sp. S37]
MTSIKDRVNRSLDTLDAGRPLVRLVYDIIRDYPDPFTLANQHAAAILRKHTGRAMSARFIWWHQFESASSSARTFTGWQHHGRPLKSMRLAELIIRRFDSHFQEAPDDLDLNGGFYRQGPHANSFDERNEVRMLGSNVKADLWALDFAQANREQINGFWRKHKAHYQVLGKVNVLGQGRRALDGGRINQTDWGRLRALVASDLAEGDLPTLAILQRSSNANPFVISRYALDESDRGCLYSLAAADGRTLLYLPWSEKAFQGFESELTMAAWLRQQLGNPSVMNAFATAAHADAQHAEQAHGIRTHLRSIADSQTDQAAEALLAYMKRPLKGDFFAYLSNQVAHEMRISAAVMTSNADLRKAMWTGYLGAFIKVFGGFAPLGWPMALTLLGASVGKVGLEVDVALNTQDEQGRKAALRSAMLDTLFAALNMADLGFQSSFAFLTYEAPQNEAGASLEQWQVAPAATLPIEGIETNALVEGELAQHGRLHGVRVNDDGSCWITLNGLSYRVRYSHELSAWLVVKPDNPFSFGPIYPVRLNQHDEWELLVPPRLLGGTPPPVEGMGSVSSQFWDAYTSVNAVDSKILSASALHRQKALLKDWAIPELPVGQAPALDSRGLDCILQDGSPQYTYRYNRDYFNSLIEYYTCDETTVNDVFRVGFYKYGDEDDYLLELAGNLERLPKNQDVSLYRGGHLSRGTGGERYRTGKLKVGDVLVNTDLTSFTENPYMVTAFASQRSAQAPIGQPGIFDDTSVVFELPAKAYQDGTPISAFSLYWDEAETLFLPGRYFRIDKLQQVYGQHYRFIHVTLRQIEKPAAGPFYDLRTGQEFDLSSYRARFRTPALADRFFPG